MTKNNNLKDAVAYNVANYFNVKDTSFSQNISAALWDI